MAIQIEFYGIPRKRTGVESTMLETIASEIRLGEVFSILSARFPELAKACMDGNQLLPGYVASIDGKEFVDDSNTCLYDGQSLLIMSSDAGG